MILVVLMVIGKDEDKLAMYRSHVGWARAGCGYALIGGSRSLRSKDQSDHVENKYRKAGVGTFNADDDVIIVHLDLVNYTWGYTVNDEHFGIAFENIQSGDYRLAISLTMRKGESKFQFL